LVKSPLDSSAQFEGGCKPGGSGKRVVSIACYARMNRRKKNGITFGKIRCARGWLNIGLIGRTASDSNYRSRFGRQVGAPIRLRSRQASPYKEGAVVGQAFSPAGVFRTASGSARPTKRDKLQGRHLCLPNFLPYKRFSINAFSSGRRLSILIWSFSVRASLWWPVASSTAACTASAEGVRMLGATCTFS